MDRTQNLTVWLKEVGISGFLDMAIMTFLIYSVLVWLKRPRRTASVLTGIVIVAGIYLLARQFNLFLTAAVLHGFFAVILVALVVIFQEELRYFFEQVTYWSLRHRFSTSNAAPLPTPRRIEVLVRTVFELAREKTGALIVLRGRDLLVRHLHGGEELNGQVSEPILTSIFDDHSSGHDGAVVIENDIITRFACHLPLSKDLQKLQRGGTRHAAALGLSELTDALCIVVSEERGVVSTARHGTLRAATDPESLVQVLEEFFKDTAPDRKTTRGVDFLKKNWREKLVALLLAMALWFVLLHESKRDYRAFTIPVDYTQLPAEYVVKSVQPSEVKVTVSGPRKAFYFISKEELRLTLKLSFAREGKIDGFISSSDISLPQNLLFENVQPRVVALVIEKKPPASE